MANSRICSIPDCGKPVKGRGWCAAHYHRWTRHGDPLKGGTFYGEPMRYFTEVVMPHNDADCLIWPYARMANGYAEMRFDGTTRIVAREVCRRRHGEPPSPQHEAAHSCGRGHEGCVSGAHLRWATSKENKDDQLKHGTRHNGERNGQSRLTESQAREILTLYPGRSFAAIGRHYGVSEATVRDIVRGRTWAWLE